MMLHETLGKSMSDAENIIMHSRHLFVAVEINGIFFSLIDERNRYSSVMVGNAILYVNGGYVTKCECDCDEMLYPLI